MQEPKVSFDYALMLGTLKTPTHLQLMQWQANNAVQHFLATGQMTVLVLDNATPDKSLATQQCLQRWLS